MSSRPSPAATDWARPKSRKKAADASTSGTPKVIDVKRCNPMAGQIRSNDRELQDVIHDGRTGSGQATPPPGAFGGDAHCTARRRTGRVRRTRLRGRLDPSDRRGGRHPSATDQLPLRLEGRAVARGGRPPLRSPRRHGRDNICATRRPRPTTGRGSPTASDRSSGQPPSSRNSTGSWCRKRPSTPIGCTGSSSVTPARRFERLIADWQALRADGRGSRRRRAVLYYSLVGAASLAYVNAPEAQAAGPRHPERVVHRRARRGARHPVPRRAGMTGRSRCRDRRRRTRRRDDRDPARRPRVRGPGTRTRAGGVRPAARDRDGRRDPTRVPGRRTHRRSPLDHHPARREPSS